MYRNRKSRLVENGVNILGNSSSKDRKAWQVMQDAKFDKQIQLYAFISLQNYSYNY